MPIGSGIVYNTGDLILNQVSSSGTAFLETKIAAATSSLIYFDSTARINSASLNSITVGTASYVSGSNSIVTNFTASNISASGTGSFGVVGIGSSTPNTKLDVRGQVFINNVTANTPLNQLTLNLNGTNYAQFYDLGTSANTLVLGGSPLITTLPTASISASLMSWAMNSGYVGIGTTSPSAKLTIVDNTNGGTINLVGRTSDDTAAINFRATGDGSTYAYVAPDTNEFRLYHNDGFMSFYPGGSEKVRITSAGNVGIGTTIPSVRLHVSGSSILANNISIDPDAYSNTIIAGAISDRAGWGLSSAIGGNAGTGHSWAVGTNGGYLYMGYGNGSSNDSLQEFLMVSGSRNLYLVPVSGNIGVGTFSVYQKLTINGAIETGANGSTTGGPSFYIKYDGASGNYINSIGTEYSSGNTILGYGITGKSSSAGYVSTFANFSGHRGMLMIGAGTLEFKNSRTSLATAVGSDVPMTSSFYIDNSGNVGIGTTTPSAKLNIASTSQTTKAIIQSVSAATGLGGYLAFNPGGDSTYSKVAIGVYDNYYSSYNRGNIAFMINSAADAAEVGFTDTKMYISASGNVGIGTTSPASLLELSSSTATSLLNIKGAGGNGLLFVSGSGNVGIGTTSPIYSLDVIGNARVGDSLYVTTATTSDAAIEIGRGRSGNGNSYVDLIGDATYTDYGLRLIRSNGGANTTSAIAHRGTGTLYITAVEAASIALETSNTTRMTINSSGNVGIGTTAPAVPLDVLGNTATVIIRTSTSISSSYSGLRIYNDQNNLFRSLEIDYAGSAYAGSLITGAPTGEAATIATTGAYPLVLGTSNTARLTITSGGDVGINTITPGAKLDVNGAIRVGVSSINTHQFTGSIAIYPTGSSIDFSTTGLPNTTTAKIFVGKSPNPAGSLTSTLVSGYGADDYGLILQSNVSGDCGGIKITDDGVVIWGAADEDLIRIVDEDNNLLRFVIDNIGNVGIGTTSPGAFLDVSGSTRFGYTSTNTHQFTGSVNVNGSVSSTKIAEKVVTFTPLTGSITGAPAWYRIISGSGILDSGRVRLSANFDNSRSDLEFTYNVRNYDSVTGSGAFINITRASVYNNLFTAVRVIETGTLAEPYAIDVLIGNYVGLVSPGVVTCLYETQYPGAIVNTPAFVSASATGSFTVKTVYTANSAGWPTLGPVYSDSLAVATTQGQLGVGYRGNYAYDTPSGLNYALLVSGSVGIGTDNPSRKLQVDAGTSGPALRLTNTNSNSGIELLTAATKYSWLLGAQYNIDGAFEITPSTAVGGTTFSSPTAVFTQTGNVGVGTTNPVAKLQVAGNVSGSSFTSSISNAVGFLGTSSWAQNVVSASYATTAQTANALNASNTYTVAGLTSAYVDVTGAGTIPTTGIYRPSSKTLGLSADATLILKINGSVSPYVTSIESGNLGIGTSSPSSKLEVAGDFTTLKDGADTIQRQIYIANAINNRAFNFQLNSGGTGLDLWSYNSSNAWLKHTTFDYDGKIGIGTTSPGAKLEISGSSNSALLNIKSPISGAILYVSGSGAIGVGDSNVGTYRLYVSGSFGATTKSFIIDHPTKAGKKLIYGSLESPYHGIRLTGRDTLVNGKCKVELPEYIYKLILHDSVNIQLTGIKCNKTLYVDEINIPENYFTIAYDKAIFESYKDYDFFWDFTAIRADVPELITEL